MIEAMACGTPVLAFAGGAVREIVRDGVNGWICRDVDDMARRIGEPPIPAAECRGICRVALLDCDDGRTRTSIVYGRALAGVGRTASSGEA